MKVSRRKFCSLGVGALAGVLSYRWIALSESWNARFLRERISEFQREIVPASRRPNLEKWSAHQITASWLGHSSVLINFYGLTILTDPALMERVGIAFELGVLGPKRYVAPALKIEELPPIDLVLLSHAHMDHLDLPTLRHFTKRTQVVTACATAGLLNATKFGALQELRWGESTLLQTPAGEIKIEAFEVKHWGARWRYDTFRGYNGYILSREGRHLLFGGDTASCRYFESIRSKAPIDLAFMPIGAYNPWIYMHCTPEEAVVMADSAGARYIAPIHHSTFKLSDESQNEPMDRFEKALRNEKDRIALSHMGEVFSMS